MSWDADLASKTGGIRTWDTVRGKALCGDGRERNIHSSVPHALRRTDLYRYVPWTRSPYHDPLSCVRFWRPHIRSAIVARAAAARMPYTETDAVWMLSNIWAAEPWLEQGATGWPGNNPSGYSYYGGEHNWSWLINPRTIAAGRNFPTLGDYYQPALNTWVASLRRVTLLPNDRASAALCPALNAMYAHWIGTVADYCSRRAMPGWTVENVVRVCAGDPRHGGASYRHTAGSLERDTLDIWINEAQSECQRWKTAVHEAFHAGAASACGGCIEPTGEELAAIASEHIINCAALPPVGQRAARVRDAFMSGRAWMDPRASWDDRARRALDHVTSQITAILT
jgi:hypothetical protein